MRTRIPKEPLEVIVRRLVEGLQPEQIILFGSYAYGQPSEGSDLDIMIIVPESSEPAHRREQKAYACVGAVGVPKDLLVLTREEFEKQVRVVTSLARRVKEKGLLETQHISSLIRVPLVYWSLELLLSYEITSESQKQLKAKKLSFFGDLNGEKVIDVGCGKGRFLRILQDKFPQAQLHGLDISEAMLRYCPQGVQTLCGSILDIRYPDATFDAVYCVEALEHAVRIEAAVREMCRILKPGGKVLIIDKNKAKLGRLQISPWEKWFSRGEIEKLLQKYDVQAESRLIAYEQHEQPDGLFIAWEGVKF